MVAGHEAEAPFGGSAGLKGGEARGSSNKFHIHCNGMFNVDRDSKVCAEKGRKKLLGRTVGST